MNLKKKKFSNMEEDERRIFKITRISFIEKGKEGKYLKEKELNGRKRKEEQID